MKLSSLTTPHHPMPADPNTFEEQTADVLMRLRGSIGRAMAILPEGVRKSQDIQKRFELSFAISWKIYRIMRAEHLLEIVPYVPAPRLMEKFLAAISRNGVAPDAVDAIRDTYEAFQHHVRNSAGDRAGFEAMTTQLIGGTTDAEIEIAHRRSLFDSHRYVVGMEQESFIAATVLHPHADDLLTSDMLSIHIRHNLRRLRPDVVIQVGNNRLWRKADTPSGTLAMPNRPLNEAAAEKYGIAILPEFCSQPDLTLQQIEMPGGRVVTRWMADGVGISSAIDLGMGTYNPNLRIDYSLLGSFCYQFLMNVTTPTRKFVRDFILHRSLAKHVEFAITRWGYVIDLPEYTQDLETSAIPPLPCSDRIAFVGDIDAAYVPEVPNYAQMIKKYCEKFGWKVDDMLVYRTRTDYPLLHVVQRVNCLFPTLAPPKK